MEIVIIDCRDGGTRLSAEAQKEIETADITLTIAQDGVVNYRWSTNSYEEPSKVKLFYAETEAEDSARNAAQHIEGRIGKPRSEHNNAAAMAKVRAVWDDLAPQSKQMEK